jgi:hypothetical protein
MAERHARPGSLDINPDVVQVPADRHGGYPGSPCPAGPARQPPHRLRPKGLRSCGLSFVSAIEAKLLISSSVNE